MHRFCTVPGFKRFTNVTLMLRGHHKHIRFTASYVLPTIIASTQCTSKQHKARWRAVAVMMRYCLGHPAVYPGHSFPPTCYGLLCLSTGISNSLSSSNRESWAANLGSCSPIGSCSLLRTDGPQGAKAAARPAPACSHINAPC